jgi:hypothetical protein
MVSIEVTDIQPQAGDKVCQILNETREICSDILQFVNMLPASHCLFPCDEFGRYFTVFCACHQLRLCSDAAGHKRHCRISFEVQAKPQIVGIGIEIVLCQQIVVRVFAKVMFEQR